MKCLFPNPKNDNEIWQELAYQLGRSEGFDDGYDVGVEAAQATMRSAQAKVQHAMGIRKELGA